MCTVRSTSRGRPKSALINRELVHDRKSEEYPKSNLRRRRQLASFQPRLVERTLPETLTTLTPAPPIYIIRGRS